MSASTKSVFLSYASQDAEAARRICDALRAVDQSHFIVDDKAFLLPDGAERFHRRWRSTHAERLRSFPGSMRSRAQKSKGREIPPFVYR